MTSSPSSCELEERRADSSASESALAATRAELAEAQQRLAAAGSELEALRRQHTELVAKHEQRERDFDLLLSEQRDTAAALASAAADLEQARQQAARDSEGLASQADEVRTACLQYHNRHMFSQACCLGAWCQVAHRLPGNTLKLCNWLVTPCQRGHGNNPSRLSFFPPPTPLYR